MMDCLLQGLRCFAHDSTLPEKALSVNYIITLVTISTADPDGIDSTEGLTEFVVLRAQVSVPYDESA